MGGSPRQPSPIAPRVTRGDLRTFRATLTVMTRGLATDGAVSGYPTPATPGSRPTASRRSHLRLHGVDAARAIAVLGMVMVHVGPTSAPDTALGNLYGVSHGRASVLFVLLAGVGVAHSRRRLSRGRPSLVRGRLILRAECLSLFLYGYHDGPTSKQPL